MSYTIKTARNGIHDQTKTADTLKQASEVAVSFVYDRMEAFGEDREALERYGFLAAEQQALDLTDWGTKIMLSDGWEMHIINDDRSETA